MKVNFKNINLVRLVYSKLPLSLKPGYKTYSKYRDLIKTTEFTSKESLEAFQFVNLKRIVNYAWNNVPGYKKLWLAHKFTPDKLQSLEDINLIPFITKEILRDSVEDFTTRQPIRKKYVTTGGSTGIPFGFYQDYDSQFIEAAFIYNLWSRFVPGVSPITTTTNLRGYKFNGSVLDDPIGGLYLSSYNLRDNNIKLFCEMMDKKKTEILQAYPSSAYVLAKKARDLQLSISHVFKCVMLGSEPLYEFQKILLRSFFNTKLCFWYGHAEQAVLAGNCEYSDQFHVYPQYGATEILDSSGNSVEEGCLGEVVATSFWNLGTPFIRYKTKDFAVLGNTSCVKCNRNYTLLTKIEGRLQEFIVGKSGGLVSMTSINFHNDVFDDLAQFRFVQEKKGLVILTYIRKKDKETVDEKKIYSGLKEKLGNDYDLLLEEVRELPLTAIGKLRFLDQKLDVALFI